MASALELQRLHDGELSPEQAERLRKSLTPAEHERLAALGRLAETTRAGLLAACAEMPALDWAALESRLDAPAVRRARRRWGWKSQAIGVSAMAAAAAVWFLLSGGPGSGKAVLIETVEFGQTGGVVLQNHDQGTTVLWQSAVDEP